MDRIGFGIIGAGMIGNLHADVLSGMARAGVKAVYDTDAARAAELASKLGCAGYSDLEAFFRCPGVLATSICTPSATHGELAIMAARRGKHVIIEKPMDISVQKADRIIAECKERNVKCAVVSQHRFDDGVVALKEAVNENALGRLYYGAAHTRWYRNEEYYANTGWRGTWAFDGGGALINQSIHYIDLLLYIMGDVREVFGCCATLRHRIEVEDTGVATLKFANGGIGIIQGTTIAYPGLSATLEIYGENGSVAIKDDRMDFWSIKGDRRTAADFGCGDIPVGAGDATNISAKSHARQFEDFINAIEYDKEPLVNGVEGRRTLALIQDIYKSSNENKPVICG